MQKGLKRKASESSGYDRYKSALQVQREQESTEGFRRFISSNPEATYYSKINIKTAEGLKALAKSNVEMLDSICLIKPAIKDGSDSSFNIVSSLQSLQKITMDELVIHTEARRDCFSRIIHDESFLEEFLMLQTLQNRQNPFRLHFNFYGEFLSSINTEAADFKAGCIRVRAFCEENKINLSLSFKNVDYSHLIPEAASLSPAEMSKEEAAELPLGVSVEYIKDPGMAALTLAGPVATVYFSQYQQTVSEARQFTVESAR